MAIILIPLTFILIASLIRRMPNCESIIDAIIKSYTVVLFLVFISTEMLSIKDHVSYRNLALFWLVVACFSGVLLYKLKNVNIGNNSAYASDVKLFKTILYGIVLLLFLSFITSILYPPNNYDSMTYHMARVAHWISNESVAFYPTSIERQLYQMPLAEYAILHTCILSGGDTYAGMVQWSAYVVSAIIVFLVATELGLNRVHCLLASLVFVTIPMAVLQSSSTQNDLVVASFVLVFGLQMLRLRHSTDWTSVLFAGLSMGLALLTKGTGWMYCAVLGVVLSFHVFIHAARLSIGWTGLFLRMGSIVLLGLAINTGHMSRCHSLYGRFFATGNESYFTEDYSLDAIVANVVKNASLHMGLPCSQFNGVMNHAVGVLLGSEIENTANMFGGTRYRVIFRVHEDFAGNPLHMVLILVTVLIGFISNNRMDRKVFWYLSSVSLCAVCFLVVLKWQLWGSRLHTGVFALFCPLIPMIMVSVKRKWLSSLFLGMMACMYLYSIWFVMGNSIRSLSSLNWWNRTRTELYFENRRSLYPVYHNVMRRVNASGALDIGLVLGNEDWEYPFWVMGNSGMRFHHVCVANSSARFGEDECVPDYVIVSNNAGLCDRLSGYQLVYSEGILSLLRRES